VRSGSRAGAVLQLRCPNTSFGRAAENDYRFGEDEGISRVHCIIHCENRRFLLRDNGSTNGTLVNGNPITEIELRTGDVIQMGDIEMEFLSEQIQ
jgi:pSer/pThr/pTyr-binding forkhead associated (FHA) protein